MESSFFPSGYNIAYEVLEQLESKDKSLLYSALAGIKHSETGKNYLKEGSINSSRSALQEFYKAHKIFERIPEAKSLLGITKADMAAACGNLGEHSQAIAFAEDAIAIVANAPKLEFTEAMARMTLGNVYSITGRLEKGKSEFEKVRKLLSKLPNTREYLAILERNEKAIAVLNVNKRNKTFEKPNTSSLYIWGIILLVLLFISINRSCL